MQCGAASSQTPPAPAMHSPNQLSLRSEQGQRGVASKWGSDRQVGISWRRAFHPHQWAPEPTYQHASASTQTQQHSSRPASWGFRLHRVQRDPGAGMDAPHRPAAAPPGQTLRHPAHPTGPGTAGFPLGNFFGRRTWCPRDGHPGEVQQSSLHVASGGLCPTKQL